MIDIDLEHEDDPEILRQVIKLQLEEIERLQAKIEAINKQIEQLQGHELAAAKEELAKLQAQIAKRKKKSQGHKSERRRRKRRDKEPSQTLKTGHGPTPQKALPTEEIEHDLDEPDKVCKACGGQLDLWPGQEEITEEVDVVERRYVLKKHIKKKYRCKCQGCIEIAEGPTKLIKGGRYSLDFAIDVVLDKYGEHLPLERQCKRMKREGLITTSQTLWDQSLALSHLFAPVLKRLHAYLLSRELLCADESRWPLLGAKDQKGKTWQVWSLCSDDAVLYKILNGRGLLQGTTMLQGYTGIVMCDGYAVYESLSKSEGFLLAQCWAHTRRAFLQAEADFPEVCTPILDWIDELFLVDRETKTGPPEGQRARRAAARESKSRALVQKLKAQVNALDAPSESKLAEAALYFKNRFPGLEHFLEDARIPLSSNAVEQAIRTVVLGRKNHYGSKSERGTQVAAGFYSLLESCALNEINPRRYLREGAILGLRNEEIPLPHELKA